MLASQNWSKWLLLLLVFRVKTANRIIEVRLFAFTSPLKANKKKHKIFPKSNRTEEKQTISIYQVVERFRREIMHISILPSAEGKQWRRLCGMRAQSGSLKFMFQIIINIDETKNGHPMPPLAVGCQWWRCVLCYSISYCAKSSSDGVELIDNIRSLHRFSNQIFHVACAIINLRLTSCLAWCIAFCLLFSTNRTEQNKERVELSRSSPGVENGGGGGVGAK